MDPYVICAPCVGVKSGDCLDACPSNSIHPLPTEPGYGAATQLFIDPGTCTSCGECVTACPEDAIYRRDQVPSEWTNYIAINANHFT